MYNVYSKTSNKLWGTTVWISRLDKEIARYHVGLVWLGAMPYHVSALASSQEGHVGGKGE